MKKTALRYLTVSLFFLNCLSISATPNRDTFQSAYEKPLFVGVSVTANTVSPSFWVGGWGMDWKFTPAWEVSASQDFNILKYRWSVGYRVNLGILDLDFDEYNHPGSQIGSAKLDNVLNIGAGINMKKALRRNFYLGLGLDINYFDYGKSTDPKFTFDNDLSDKEGRVDWEANMASGARLAFGYQKEKIRVCSFVRAAILRGKVNAQTEGHDLGPQTNLPQVGLSVLYRLSPES